MVVITAPGKRPVLTTGANRSTQGEPPAEPISARLQVGVEQGESGDNQLEESVQKQPRRAEDYDATPVLI